MGVVPRSPDPVVLFDNSHAPTLAALLSLGSRAVPLHVYGSTTGAAARWSRYCTRYEHCPSIDRADLFLPWLREKIQSNEIQRVFPTTDLIAYYLSTLREEFPDPVRRTIPTLTEIEHCLIKSRFNLLCSQQGFETPGGGLTQDLAGALELARCIGYPLICKPNSHLGVGANTRGEVFESEASLCQRFKPYPLLDGHAGITARYPELRSALLQRYLPAAEQRVYSVSGVKDAAHGVLAAALSYKCEQWPPRTGISVRQVSCQDQGILENGLRLVDTAISGGIFELELVVQDDRLYAIELNPRCFGFVALDIATGNDLPWLWYLSSRDQAPARVAAATPVATECHSLLHRYAKRVFAWIWGRPPPARTGAAWVPMAGRWRDPIPMLISHLSLLRHPRSLLRAYWRPGAPLRLGAASQEAPKPL